jgi:hypothetical protein
VSLQILWKTTRKFVLPARLSKDYCVGLTFVVGKGRIRVERDPALCGRLNEEVGHLGGVTEPRDKSVGAKAKTPPFARCLHQPRCTNEDKKTGGLTLRPASRWTKAHDEVILSRGLVQHGGPRVIWPIVTGPAWPLRITSLICKGFPVITICNPALWEYSRDNLGA